MLELRAAHFQLNTKRSPLQYFAFMLDVALCQRNIGSNLFFSLQNNTMTLITLLLLEGNVFSHPSPSVIKYNIFCC